MLDPIQNVVAGQQLKTWWDRWVKNGNRCGTEMGVSPKTRNLHALTIKFDRINQSHWEASSWQIWIWTVFIHDLVELSDKQMHLYKIVPWVICLILNSHTRQGRNLQLHHKNWLSLSSVKPSVRGCLQGVWNFEAVLSLGNHTKM